jgi:hypothetical protein
MSEASVVGGKQMSNRATAQRVADGLGWELFSWTEAMVIFRRPGSHDLVWMSHGALNDLARVVVPPSAAAPNVVPLRQHYSADARPR